MYYRLGNRVAKGWWNDWNETHSKPSIYHSINTLLSILTH